MKKIVFKFIVLLVCSTIAIGSNTAIAAENSGKITWKVNISKVGVDLEGAAYGNGRYVAVGEGGMIRTSSDGRNWTSRVSGLKGEILEDVIFDGKKFVAVGCKGKIITSPDGIKWTKAAAVTKEDIMCIVWNGKQYLAAGPKGSFLISKDGFKWSRKAWPSGFYALSVIWDGKRYVAAGGEETIMSSRDGLNWTKLYQYKGEKIPLYSFSGQKASTRQEIPYWFTGIEYAKGVYVAVTGYKGYIAVSKDAVKWTYTWVRELGHGGNTPLSDVEWDGKMFSVIGSGSFILKSEDTKKWQVVYNPDNIQLERMVYVKDHFIAVGRSGVAYISKDGVACDVTNYASVYKDIAWNGKMFAVVGYDGLVSVSNDGYKWSDISLKTSQHLLRVIWTGKLFVAVGTNGIILTSADGLHWNETDTGVKDQIVDIAFNGNSYAAVTKFGSIISSGDGVNWKAMSFEGNFFGKVVWNGQKYVALGYRGNLFNSADGVSWTETYLGTDCVVSDIIRFGSKYIAVGVKAPNTYIFTSNDGVKWSKGIELKGVQLDKLASDGKKCIAAGTYGDCAVSVNGTNWQRKKINKESDAFIFFKHINKHFIGLTNSGSITTSTDGVKWTTDWSGTQGFVNSVAWDGKKYVAVGENMLIMTGTAGK